MKRLFGACGCHVKESHLLVAGAQRHEALEECVDLPRLLVTDHRRRRHDQVSFPGRWLLAMTGLRGLPAVRRAWQIQPAQQRLAAAIAVAIEGRHQDMVEFETLGAVNRQYLHGRGRMRLRLRVKVRQHGVQGSDPAPLSSCRALTQRIEERARMT